MTDQEYLNRAVELAAKSLESVGCGVVIVSGDEILAEEFNSQHADNQAINHAEIKAIVAANKRTGSRTLENATAYCSCEPCAMCITALSYAKVSRIVFAQPMKDLFPGDKQGDFDSKAFIETLNFQPTLEQIV